MSTNESSKKHQGRVPANIEEGVDPFRFTSAAASFLGPNECSFSALEALSELSAQDAPARNKRRVFAEVIAIDPKAKLVTSLLQDFIKRTRFLKMRFQPKEYYVRQQACMVGFLLYTRVKKQRLGYRDIRELFVNLYDLYDYCCNGIPKSAAVTLLRLIYRLLVIMADVASAIELASNQRATNWALLASSCKSVDVERNSEFDVRNIMPETTLFATAQILGQGGFGVVTRATFGNALEVAVKMVPLDKQVLPKYAVVDKVSACMVNHPLVMKYYCTFRCSAAYVTVMEVIHAVDLLDVVNEYSKQRLLPLHVKQFIVSQVCLALTHLHFKGFIHRDIKPSNVMICHGCRIKLFDFDTVKIGMGKFSNKPLQNFYSRTATEFLDRETAGTIYFFPPEALLKRNYGRSIDWWALGVTLFELAYGYLPFRSAERAILKDLIKSGDYAFPKCTNLDMPEAKFIERCLQKNPLKRLCAGDYSEYRSHEYLKDMNWPQVEVNAVINWHGVDHLLQRQDKAKKEAKTSKLATMPFIEHTTLDSDSPPLYTFTSSYFLHVIDKVRILQAMVLEDPPELVELDVVQKYRFRDLLM